MAVRECTDGLRQDVTDTRYNTDGTVFSQTKVTWGYDADQRLTSEALTVLQGAANAPSPYSDTFKYDLDSNRTEEDITGSQTATVTYTYSGDNQLLTENRTGNGAYAITYGYDNNGSLTSQIRTGTNPETDNYGYDARNRMTLATINGTSTTYGYDDDDVRVSESTGGSTTYYLNDPQNPTGYTKAVEECTTQNATTVSRAYVIGKTVIAQSDSNGVLYLMHDGHGSTRAMLTSTGNIFISNGIAQRIDYAAFGDVLVLPGGVTATNQALTSWQFAGDGLVDQVTGWRYSLARFDNGFWWTQMDSFTVNPGEIADANLYQYAASDPISVVDPNGQFSLPSIVVSAGIMGFLAGLLWPAPSMAIRMNRAVEWGIMAFVAADMLVVAGAAAVIGLAYVGVPVVGGAGMITAAEVAIGGTAFAAGASGLNQILDGPSPEPPPPTPVTATRVPKVFPGAVFPPEEGQETAGEGAALEEKYAEEIAERGYVVKMHGQGRGPDLEVSGNGLKQPVPIGVKGVFGSRPDAVVKRLKEARNNGDVNVILDTTESELTSQQVMDAIQDAVRKGYFNVIERIRVVTKDFDVMMQNVGPNALPPEQGG